MSPGQNGTGAESSGNSSDAAPHRKKPIQTTVDDWMGLAGNGQGSAKPGAAAPSSGGIGEGSAVAPSGSLLDDWAGGGGAVKADGGVDRNLLLQKKVGRIGAVFV